MATADDSEAGAGIPPAGAPKNDEELLALARRRFDLAVDAESDIRKQSLDDQKFRAGDQWPQDVKNSRDIERRPCLTINRLPQFVNQIVNDQRQNRPSIKVNPVDDQATKETAKIFQGLIRHIEYNSNADIAYDTAFEQAVVGGRGYFRILTAYKDPTSFEQEIFIKRIRDHNTVYTDPHYQEPDGSDMDWAFIFEELSKDEFKSKYPKAKLSLMDDWKSIGDRAADWISKDTARVSEYFFKTFKNVTIVKLSNGQRMDKAEYLAQLKTIPEPQEGEAAPQIPEIVDERESVLPAIKWVKMNGIEVLESTDWLGQWIPLIPVLGAELIVDGKRILEGIVRHAKDPQRMYNYWATSETELIALAPRAPFIGAKGQFEGFERQWQTANTKSHPYIEYNEKSSGGVPVGPPTRNQFEPPVQAISMARGQSSDDLKATTGIYDPTLGNKSNETSGVAIQRRNIQSQTSNFHFADNLTRSLRHAGRICIDLIPHIYPDPMIGRIIGEDGEVQMVPLNQEYEEKGKKMIHDLDAGSYDVTVTTGPSYSTKRQEAAAAMLDFTKALPQTAPMISDLLVRQMDWPGADMIADRLKKALPPGIAEVDDKQTPLPPAAQQQLQQQGQMIQQLTQHLDVATDEIEKKKFELESRERIEMAKIQADIEITLATLKAKSGQALLEHQVGAIQHRLDLLGANQPIENGNDPNAGNPAAPSAMNQPTGGIPPGSPMGA